MANHFNLALRRLSRDKTFTILNLAGLESLAVFLFLPCQHQLVDPLLRHPVVAADSMGDDRVESLAAALANPVASLRSE